MLENLLVPLPGFTLPPDFPWRIKFIAAVDEQLRRLRATGHYVPARFFGYYFQGMSPVGISASPGLYNVLSFDAIVRPVPLVSPEYPFMPKSSF